MRPSPAGGERQGGWRWGEGDRPEAVFPKALSEPDPLGLPSADVKQIYNEGTLMKVVAGQDDPACWQAAQLSEAEQERVTPRWCVARTGRERKPPPPI